MFKQIDIEIKYGNNIKRFKTAFYERVLKKKTILQNS